jgi:hypothetical protein
MYENTKLAVKISGDKRTEFFSSHIGIRQGDNLSPNLFKLLLDDLPKELNNAHCNPVMLNNKKVNCLLYADDIVLISESPEGLQTAIDITEQYGSNLGLEINTKKTKIMTFSCTGRKSIDTYTVNNNHIEEVQSYKYLGLQLSSCGNMTLARANLYASAIKAFFKFRRTLDHKHIKVTTLIKIFEALIEPILLYSCEITNVFNITKSVQKNKIKIFEKTVKWEQERLNMQFCRYILGVGPKATNMAIYSELGRYPIFIKAMKQIWKFYNRCLNSNENTLIHDALQEQNNYISKTSSWLHFVKFITESLEIPFTMTEINEELATSKLKGLFQELWRSKLNNDLRQQNHGNKLRTYRKFKMIFHPEPYLNIISSFNVRRELCKFRISNHKLKIETGRHMNIELENRLCNHCNELEDEEHFLIKCIKHSEKRQKLFEKVGNSCPNFNSLTSENKLIYLLSCEDEEIIKEVGNFIFFNTRTTTSE